MDREKINAALGVTEEELARRAAEYENDTWDSSRLGKPVMGRPRLADEEVRQVTIRLPLSQIEAIDRLAACRATTRSAEVRAAIAAWVAG